MSKSPKVLASAAESARVLGLSRRQFDRLCKAGILPQRESREFDLAGVVQAYVRYVERGREGASTLAEAKLLTERERARKLALENAVKAGEVVYASQVGDLLLQLIVAAVGELEAIPGRYADVLTPISDRAAMRQKLLDIVREFRASYSGKIDALAERFARA